MVNNDKIINILDKLLEKNTSIPMVQDIDASKKTNEGGREGKLKIV